MLTGEIILEGGRQQGLIDPKGDELDLQRKFLEGKVDFVQNMLRGDAVLAENHHKIGGLLDPPDDGRRVGAAHVTGRIPDPNAPIFQLGAEIVRNIFIPDVF